MIILKLLLIVYIIAAFAAFLTCWLEQGPPAYFDHATTYGDEKLTWHERWALLVFLPSIVLFVYSHDKWPGVKGMLTEMWVYIVQGRQANPEDHK